MNDESQATIRASRLNLFAFPSDTDFRFFLLIGAVLASSLMIFAHQLPWEPRTDAYLKQCLIDFNNAWSAVCKVDPTVDFVQQSVAWQNCLASSPDISQSLEQASNDLNQCISPILQSFAVKIIFGGLLLWGIAALIYWFYPSWKIRRAKLVPISASDAPEILKYLEDLCREVGIAQPPTFLWNPLNPVVTGLAFGRHGQYYVAITGGLATKFYTDQPAFRAILLHELAHLYNADVDKTYFAIAVWLAFAAVAIISLGLDISNNSWKEVFAYGWRLLALAVLVYLTRNAILRARELYADVRAVMWDGADSALGRILARLSPSDKKLSWRWQRLLQMHPDPLDRRRTLTDTNQLFRLGYSEAFCAGSVTMVSFSSIYLTVKPLISGIPPILFSLLGVGASILLAPLVVGLIAVGIWRMIFAQLAQGDTTRRLGRLALAFCLGLLFGDIIAFTGALNPARLPAAALVRYGFVALWYLFVFVCFFLFLHWIATGASGWIGADGSSRRSHLSHIISLIAVAGVFFALWFGVLYLFRDGIDSIYAPQASFSDLVLMTIARLVSVARSTAYITPLVFCLIWAFPLSVWFLVKETTLMKSSSRAFLDPPPVSIPVARTYQLRLGSDIIVGVIGGLIACIALVPLTRNLFVTSADPYGQLRLQSATQSLNQFWLSQVFVQIFVAGIISLKIKPLGWAHGMLAAFVVGCTAFAGLLLLFSFTDLATEPYQLLTELGSFIAGGNIWALPVALLAPSFAQWFRSLPRRYSLDDQEVYTQGIQPIIGVAISRRLVAFAVDGLVWYVLSQATFFLAIPLTIVFTGYLKTDVDQLLNFYSEVSLFILYFIVFEWLCGATIGKSLFGFYVIQTNGAPCGLKASILRNIGRCLDLLLLGIPTFVVRKAPLQQTLGDTIAKTVVIKPSQQPGAWKPVVVTTCLYILLNIIVKQYALVSYFR